MYSSDCYTKEHTKISDKDFAHCDKIIVISEKEQKDFMMEHYKKYSDKMEFWQIKEVKGDSKVKKKIAKKIKEMVKKLYTDSNQEIIYVGSATDLEIVMCLEWMSVVHPLLFLFA